jgi:pilus assembly protein CpaF
MSTRGSESSITEPRHPGLVLVSGVPAQSSMPIADPMPLAELKEWIRAALMSRIDPSVVATIAGWRLRGGVAQLVSEIATENRVQLNKLKEVALAADLSDDMIGLGPPEPFLDDDQITDILANGPSDIYVERRGKLEKTGARFCDAAHLVNIAQRVAPAVGRRIDEASPMVDARLTDGSRVNIVLPPLVLNGGTISIGNFPKRAMRLGVMVSQGKVSGQMAPVLEIAAWSRLNVLISGGTRSGNTTLLNAVSQSIHPDERVITIDDAVELRLQQSHVVQMETRPPNVEGIGRVPQRDLVRNALRVQPDRIIVGEVRGPEAFDMLQAMNTGHDGCGVFASSRMRPDFLTRAEHFGFRTELLDALDVGRS